MVAVLLVFNIALFLDGDSKSREIETPVPVAPTSTSVPTRTPTPTRVPPTPAPNAVVALQGVFLTPSAATGSASIEAATGTPTPRRVQAGPPTPEEAPSKSAEGRPAESPPDATFVDVTQASGIAFGHHAIENELLQIGAGVVVFDFDDDGFQDVYLADSDGPNALYRNNGDETFVDVAVVAGVDDSTGRSNGGCSADYDGDGDQDLFVTNYGPSRLFVNNNDGTFTDRTVQAGVSSQDVSLRSTGCAWGDYDGDGYLDLIIVRHLDESDIALFETAQFDRTVRALTLYHNDRAGAFTDVTRLLGDPDGPPAGERTIWGAGFQPGWVDYDDDGDLDIYVVNDFGNWVRPNVLWRNDGPGPDGQWEFVDASEASGSDTEMFGMGLAVGDYDLDGDLDLFMTNIGDNVLLKNDSDAGMFSNDTEGANVGLGIVDGQIRVTWGAVFFDYDNDGDEDLYVVAGYLRGGIEMSGIVPEDRDDDPQQRDQPNMLLQNSGDGTFVDVSPGSGADDRGTGRGGSYLDFNNDGCLDLLVGNYGERARLYKNRCVADNNWLVVRLRSATGNLDGIGARITVATGDKTQVREVSAGSSQMGQNMRLAHFGLGPAAVVDSVTIRWPSGKQQTLTNVAANQRLPVTESE